MALPPITDHPTLVLNLSDYLARNDLEDYYPTFIALAEKRLNSALKALGMQKASTLSPTSAGVIAVPADYIEWVSVTYIPAALGARALPLRYVEPNSPENTNRFRPNGPPQFYTVSGGFIRPRPAKNTGAFEVVYYQRIPALTEAAPTNWLITTAPQLYLAATLAEAYVIQKDEARAAEWGKMADERLAQFIAESSSGKVGRRVERLAEDAAEDRAAKATT